MQLIIKHNIEVAHRLCLTPGKCQNIHGHSMQVEVHMYGRADDVDDTGKLHGLEIGDIKGLIRASLNDKYDHHLLLNEIDPWAVELEFAHEGLPGPAIPGAVPTPGDPTTENIAMWIWHDLKSILPSVLSLSITINETATNAVVYP